MNWRFGGDIQASFNLFERHLLRYEWRANDLIMNQRVGKVLGGLDSGPLERPLALDLGEVHVVAGVQHRDREVQSRYGCCAWCGACRACGAGRSG